MFTAAGLAPFPCPLGLGPVFYPRALVRKRLYGISNGLVFTTDLLLAPGHGLLGSGQRAVLGSLLWFAAGAGGAEESKRVPVPMPVPMPTPPAEPPAPRLSPKPGEVWEEHADACLVGHGKPRATTPGWQGNDTPSLLCQE